MDDLTRGGKPLSPSGMLSPSGKWSLQMNTSSVLQLPLFWLLSVRSHCLYEPGSCMRATWGYTAAPGVGRGQAPRGFLTCVKVPPDDVGFLFHHVNYSGKRDQGQRLQFQTRQHRPRDTGWFKCGPSSSSLPGTGKPWQTRPWTVESILPKHWKRSRAQGTWSSE